MKRKTKISVSAALKALRLMAAGKNRTSEADAILVVRGRLDQEGKWEIDWEAAHWLPDLEQDCISPSGLPVGFGPAAAHEIAAVSAGDVAETNLGRMGAAVGKGIWDVISDRVSTNNRQGHGRSIHD